MNDVGDGLSEMWSRDETLVDGAPQDEAACSSKENIQALLRKIDRNLMPMISILYLLSCLDRSNLGNASENGLTRDLHMTGRDEFNVSKPPGFF